MNKVLSRIIDENSPKFNKFITNGMCELVLKQIPEYLDSIFRFSIKSLNPTVPLTYEGYRMLTPEDEYNLVLKAKSKLTYDIARSDVYPINFVFRYNGEELLRPIYLPFARKGNLFMVSDVTYDITPVLSDTVITPSYISIFLRLLKDKLTVNRKEYGISFNGNKIPGLVIHTNIVKHKKDAPKNKTLTPVSLYILGKYGIKASIDKFAVKKGVINSGEDAPYIITTEDDVSKYRDKYDLYQSLNEQTLTIPNNIKILIHKNRLQSDWLNNFITGIIYAFDVYPQFICDFFEQEKVKDEIYFWRLLLARIEFQNAYSVMKLEAEMREHFNSLEYYLDPLIETKLAQKGIFVKDFFELLSYLIDNFNKLILDNKEYNSDLNNRYIDILYYICYNFIRGFNRSMIDLNKRDSKKTTSGTVSKENVNKVLSQSFNNTLVFKLVKSKETNLAIQLTDATSDVMYPKVTAVLED